MEREPLLYCPPETTPELENETQLGKGVAGDSTGPPRCAKLWLRTPSPCAAVRTARLASWRPLNTRVGRQDEPKR